jgi:hypothetical protein
MTPMLLAYGVLTLPYLAAIARFLAASHWTRLGTRALP